MRLRHAFLTIPLIGMLMAPAGRLPYAGPGEPPATQQHPQRVISFIGHETTTEMTRVILHADGPIDYRGGMLKGDQVILDLANTRTSLPVPVVELGAREVARVVIGPELTKEGEQFLKVRLTGVKASSHKVTAAGNELHVDLTPRKGANDRKGMPKVIYNDDEVNASVPAGAAAPPVSWARGSEPAVESMFEAVAAGEPVVTPIVTATAPPAAVPAAHPMTPMISAPASAAVNDDAAPVPPSAPAATATVAAAASATSPAPQATRPAATSAAPALTQGAVASLFSGTVADTNTSDRTLRVAAGRSITLETAVPVTRVSVSNPEVAEPVAISPTQMLVNGLAPGATSLVLWPRQGAPIVHEVVVHLDTTNLTDQLKSIFPNEDVRVQASKDSIVLSGKVSSKDVGEKLVALAGDYAGKVVNHLEGPEVSRRQVMLKVKFAEVSKSALTQLGAVLHHVDPTNPAANDRGTTGTGEFAPPAGNLINNPIGPDLSWTDAITLSFFEKSLDLGAFITALKSRGLFQELAEPTLIAADGQEASFLAGGEFPVPIAQPGANFVSVTIDWKKFGISLDFKPTIRKDGVIVMRVKPEVSALDFANAVVISGFRIPSLTVRRAETEVELRSGQSFAIAGLYDRNLLQTKSKIPVLGDIPLLGYLFRSKNLQKNHSELLVIVTPTLVDPLRPGEEPALPEMPESFDLGKPGKKN